MKIGFIGGGTMAEAILGGMLNAGIASADNIIIGEPVAPRREYLAGQYGVEVTDANAEVVLGCELVVLAVKPQDLPEVYAEIGGECLLVKKVVLSVVPDPDADVPVNVSYGVDRAVLSIVAGVRVKALAAGLKAENIIRVMPNTPAQIGQGMTMWTCAPSVSQAHRDATAEILSTIGDAVYVDDEKYLDMATALSASGPAYVFLIVEALIDAGVYVGLPRDTARRLALQTIKGSVALIAQTGQHPAALKDLVTSPGGTTAEGLQALERAGVPAAIVDAVNAAYRKSIRLGQE